MKTLAIIWTAAVLSGLGAVTYINSSINALVAKEATPLTSNLQVKALDRTGRIVVAPQEEGGSNVEAYILNGKPVLAKVINTYNPQQTQGVTGYAYELQPAAGYGMLNRTLQ